ncbi:MAG: hypothetical protein ACRC6E_05720 [Fusobacteriaceae bacterium]
MFLNMMLSGGILVGLLVVVKQVKEMNSLNEKIKELKLDNLKVNSDFDYFMNSKAETIKNKDSAINSLERKVKQIKEQTNVWILEKEQEIEILAKDNELLTTQLNNLAEDRYNDTWDHAIELDSFVEEIWRLEDSEAILRCLTEGSREARRQFIKNGRLNVVENK